MCGLRPRHWHCGWCCRSQNQVHFGDRRNPRKNRQERQRSNKKPQPQDAKTYQHFSRFLGICSIRLSTSVGCIPKPSSKALQERGRQGKRVLCSRQPEKSGHTCGPGSLTRSSCPQRERERERERVLSILLTMYVVCAHERRRQRN